MSALYRLTPYPFNALCAAFNFVVLVTCLAFGAWGLAVMNAAFFALNAGIVIAGRRR